LVPIKSNASFELWQSSVVDDDGVVTVDTFLLHPFVNADGVQRRRYLEVGEPKYLEEKNQQWPHWAAKHPGETLNRIASRFLAAFVWYHPLSFSEYGTSRLFGKQLWTIAGTLSILLILLDRRRKIPPEVTVAISAWVLFLIPYIAASFYDRYFWPTLPMQFIVIAYAANCLLDRFAAEVTRHRG
jgi:hypothetical protein